MGGINGAALMKPIALAAKTSQYLQHQQSGIYVTNKDQRHDSIANRIHLLHIRDQCPRGAVVQPVGETHHAARPKTPHVDGGFPERLQRFHRFSVARAWWPARLQFVGGDGSLPSAGGGRLGDSVDAVSEGEFIELVDVGRMVSDLTVLSDCCWRIGDLGTLVDDCKGTESCRGGHLIQRTMRKDDYTRR